MAGGLPVLTCRQGRLGTLAAERDCGRRYRPGDGGSLAEAIRTLRANLPRPQQMARNAGEIFEERFEAQRVYQAYADSIEKLVHDFTTEFTLTAADSIPTQPGARGAMRRSRE